MRLSSLPIALVAFLFAAVGCPAETDPPPVDPPAPECSDDVACATGNECVDGACVACAEPDCGSCVGPDCDTCTAGTLGCECLSGASCATEDLVCNDTGECVARPPCIDGSENCPCLAGELCDLSDEGTLLLCDRDAQQCRRVDTASSEPALQSGGRPRLTCYSPCTQSISFPDGTFRYCNADKLMEGCLGEEDCIDGSCVGPGGSVPSCTTQAECPQHQACLDGFCLSTCAIDDDCGDEAICASMVCRQVCTTDQVGGCPGGMFCQSDNAEDGWCMPQASLSNGVTDGQGAGGLVLSATSLAFSNLATSRELQFTNPLDRSISVRIRRVSHSELTDAGRVAVTTNPLQWLRLSGQTIDRGGLVDEVVGASAAQEISFNVLPGETGVVVVGNAFNSTIARWDGVLEVTSDALGQRTVFLDYATVPDGQWVGTSYYFLDFPTGTLAKDVAIEDWRATMALSGNVANKRAKALLTENALLTKWTEFRTNPLFTFDEWQAALSSITQGGWANKLVRNDCFGLTGREAATCYLYVQQGSSSSSGLRVFSDADSVRVPTAVLEMPFSVRLAADPGASSAFTFRGRVETAEALQYPGLPPAQLVFGRDPSTCETAGAETCLVPIKSFAVTSWSAGRFQSAPGAACDAGFSATRVPWMLSDFPEDSVLDEDLNVPVRTECRDTSFPFDPADNALATELNKSLAAANPLPDGRARKRDIELLDGVMVNQDSLLLLVRETFRANLEAPAGGGTTDVADFQAYSVITLDRTGVDLSREENPFTPGVQPDPTLLAEPTGKIQGSCSPELVAELLGTTNVAGREAELASQILFGLPTVASNAVPLAGAALNKLHYLCHATGRIDGGRGLFKVGNLDNPEGCPAGSGVTWFLYDGDAVELQRSPCQGEADDRCDCLSEGSIDGDTCAAVDCSGGAIGTCATLLDDSALGGVVNDQIVARCDTPNASGTGYLGVPDASRVACNDDRFNLQAGKLFYDSTSAGGQDVSPPLDGLVDDAFRYKTSFRSRNGGSIGFVPAQCANDPSILPYCYDPGVISQIRDRTDCLMDLFTRGTLDLPVNRSIHDATKDYLEGAFSFFQPAPFQPTTDGFERLYSELLIMLGDEALTQASVGRFDLAGAQVSTFPGELFEPGGDSFSGGAGFEMQQLYRANQYYQLVLERFFHLAPALLQGLRPDQDDKNVLTLASISSYFNRVILASTNKTKIAQILAEKYQAFGRADLARHVMERAFVEAYLESVTITQILRNVRVVLRATELSAQSDELENARRSYTSALNRMRTSYREITDDVTFFGDPPDYIPFPIPGGGDQSPPRQMLDRAQSTLVLAKEREDRAISSNRQFDVDAAQFQSELAKVKENFENDLIRLCGTFEGDDGRIYPAIRKYADKNVVTTLLQSPCGLLGNGEVFDIRNNITQSGETLKQRVAAVRAQLQKIEIERDRINTECQGRVDIATIGFEASGVRITLATATNNAEELVADNERTLAQLDRDAGVLNQTASIAGAAIQAFQACNTGESAISGVCTATVVATVAQVGLMTIATVVQSAAAMNNANFAETADRLQQENNDREIQIAQLDRGADYASRVGECCLDPNYVSGQASCDRPGPLMANSQANVDGMLTDLLLAELEAKSAELALAAEAGKMSGKLNEAKRIEALQEENEQHLINVEAARNDPNVRIYANADVQAAERSFKNAMVAAFRATRMFEYYTATSYAAKGDLFRIRMIARGEDNLEDYLTDLLNAFNDFEQQFGAPSPRVHAVSLMDDIFQIPRNLDTQQRANLLVSRLKDPALLDDNGYIRIPFQTSLNETSPRTAIHKIDRIEATIAGGDYGDLIARLYLTARGTGTIRGLDGELNFYRLDPLTAVINPFFNYKKYDNYSSIYSEVRLRDRPFANSNWELVLNLRDEEVNLDMSLSGIQDVVVYFFYEDFTTL